MIYDIDSDSDIEEIPNPYPERTPEIQFIGIVGSGTGRAKPQPSSTPQPRRPSRQIQQLPTPQSTPGPSTFVSSHSPPVQPAHLAASRKRRVHDGARDGEGPSKRWKPIDISNEIMIIDDIEEIPALSPGSIVYEDSDWEEYHAGFFFPPIPVNETVIPPPNPLPQEGAVDAITEHLRSLIIEDPPPDFKIRRAYRPHGSGSVVEGLPPDRTRMAHSISNRRAPVYGSNDISFKTALRGTDLEVEAVFRKASGAVNHIAQSGPQVAIASCTVGETSSVDNVSGALMYWRRGNGENPEVIDSHWEDLTGPMRELTPETEAAGRAPSQPPIRHYYSTVTAVKFDPLRPHIFVSASLDKTVLPWFYDDKTGRVEESLEGPISNYEFLPQIIDFKPLSSILAVGCSDGCTYIHSPHINEPSCLDLRSTMQLEVTSQVWGHPNSLYSDYLFTGGGSPFVEEKTFRRGKSIRSSPAGLGWASAWIMRPDKAERACNLFSRKARRLCENLDVDPIGQRISLVSFDMKSAGSQHTLDFLDLRAPSMQSVHHQDLPRFTNGGGQVLSASFSPDGIFWACARDDNTAHVWDSRFMNRDGNPMRILSHGPGLDPKDAYGVTAMTWINHHGSSSRPVLVTGGDDGRILEWDIRTARPRVVATLETSVGYFTIGDVYKNEMPLVAGDNGGKVYIYCQRRGEQSKRV